MKKIKKKNSIPLTKETLNKKIYRNHAETTPANAIAIPTTMQFLADPLDTGAHVLIVCAGVLGGLCALVPVVISAGGPVEFPVANTSAPHVTVERVSMERDGDKDGDEDGGEDGEGDS